MGESSQAMNDSQPTVADFSAPRFDGNNWKQWRRFRAARTVSLPYGCRRLTGLRHVTIFGKIRPVTDANGQGQRVEVYDRRVYLFHVQARALYDTLGRSLGALSCQGQGEGRESGRSCGGRR